MEARDCSPRQGLESVLVLLQTFSLETPRGESAVVGNGACLGINTPGDFPGGTHRSNVKVKSADGQQGSAVVNNTVGELNAAGVTGACPAQQKNPERAVGATKTSVRDSHPTGDVATTTPACSVSAAQREAEVGWCTTLNAKNCSRAYIDCKCFMR